MRFVILLFLMFGACLSQNSYAQRGGYIIKNSKRLSGKISVKSNFKRNREVTFGQSTNSGTTTFTPKDSVSEYSIIGLRTYINLSVVDGQDSTPYFLRRIVDGKVSLFTLNQKNGKRIFTLTNGSLRELTKDNYKEALPSILTIKNDSIPDLALIRYNIRSLKIAVQLTNKPIAGLYPRFRWGVLTGISTTSYAITLSKGPESINMTGAISPFAGAFIDVPFSANHRWYLNVSSYFQKSTFSSYQNKTDMNNDYIGEVSCITAPVLFKYRSLNKKYGRYFFEMGPSVIHYLDKKIMLHQATVSATDIQITSSSISDNFTDNQINVVAGVGIELPVRNNHLFYSAGVRYTTSTGVGLDNAQRSGLIQLVIAAYF